MSTADTGARACAQGQTLSSLGEEGLLRLLAPLLPHAHGEVVGNGDDCAVLGPGDGRVVVTTDVLVEGRHFRREWSTGQDVGARAAAQNLADLAAMGACPRAVVVALVMPGSTPVPWVVDLARGLARVCEAHGAGVVGGDLSAGDSLVVSVTALGDLEGRAPVLRSGARPGDLVVHAGNLGHSAAGLDLLTAGLGDSPRILADRQAARCLALFRVPEPPLEVGPALSRAGATAMMDVSDSLLRDAARLARASGILVDLEAGLETDLETDAGPARDRGAVGTAQAWLRGQPAGRSVLAACAARLRPVAALLAEQEPVEGWRRALRWVLTGGEDHGLLATVPASAADHLPSGVRLVGRVRQVRPSLGATVLIDGAPASPGGSGQGWDHFAPGY